jgi:hypothetical protein
MPDLFVPDRLFPTKGGYSSRRAMTGSTSEALRAGKMDAARATATSTTAAVEKVMPSIAVMPYNMAVR